MDISASTFGQLMIVWLLLAIPTIVYLAPRKTATPRLSIFWGALASLAPPFGLLFILALLVKDDR